MRITQKAGLIAITALLTVGLIGCSEKETEKKPPATPDKKEVTSLTIATGGTGGTYYPLGTAIANVWSEEIEGIDVSAVVSGASVENIRNLSDGKVDMVMAINAIAADAYEGTGEFTGDKRQNFQAVGVIYPEVIQIVSTKDTGIKTVEDLKGKRVDIGPEGSGTAVAAEQILAAFGISLEDITVTQNSFLDASNKLIEGEVDAAIAIVSVPANNVSYIAESSELQLVDITGDKLDTLMEKHPFFSAYTIPSGTYDGQTADSYTVSQQAVLYVKESLETSLVYALTKHMYEKQQDIQQGHESGSQISVERALHGVTTPLHEGAKQYLEEKGITP